MKILWDIVLGIGVALFTLGFAILGARWFVSMDSILTPRESLAQYGPISAMICVGLFIILLAKIKQDKHGA